MVKIKIKNLSKSFEDKEVLKNINLTVEKNELCVLLGVSGCGKTTLLEIIAGLQDAKGDILFNDKTINNKLPSDREISMIFQNYALYPNMTVYKNVEFPLKIKKLKKKERDEKVMNALKLVDLHTRKNSSTTILSGGEKQRVAIARALVTKPKVFLMDEPLSNLDVSLRAKMRNEIRRIHNQSNTTTIYVTHDQNEAINIADKIVVMNNGTIEQIGTVEEILLKPKTLYVLEFFNQNSLNKLSTKDYNNLFKTNINNNKLIAFKANSLYEDPKGIYCIIKDIELFEHYKLLKVQCENITLLYTVPMENKYKINDEVYLSVDEAKLYLF